MLRNGSLLQIKDLFTWFYTLEGIVKAVDGISVDLCEGESLGLVGESGCGKSMTALSIMRLVPSPPGRIVMGEISLEGEDVTKLSEAAMRTIRGKSISMIFQEPMTSLNPVLTIGFQIAEAILTHQKLDFRIQGGGDVIGGAPMHVDDRAPGLVGRSIEPAVNLHPVDGFPDEIFGGAELFGFNGGH